MKFCCCLKFLKTRNVVSEVHVLFALVEVGCRSTFVEGRGTGLMLLIH